jgi:hypothetical protein
MPYSKRVKIRVRYDPISSKYVMKEKAKMFLSEYGIEENRFKQTLENIERSRKLRPFQRKVPLYRRVGLKLLMVLPMLTMAYFYFIVL